MERILELRREIDRIDEEIIRLLDRRMKLVREIRELKRRIGLDIRDPKREEHVLRRAGIYRDVFREILRLSIRLQGDG